MILVSKFDRRIKRRLGLMLLATFAVVALFGPLAHVNLGEGFDTVGLDHQSVTILDRHDADHGHSHDDDLSEDPLSRHSHEHNSADHSHEIPGVTVYSQDAPWIIPSNAYLVFAEQHYKHASGNIDRPPRS